MTLKNGLIGLGALLVFLALSLMGTYNSFIGLDEQLKSHGAQVDNMYDRRADLVPQVAAVVKRYAEFERGTQENIARLRSDSQGLENLQKMIAGGQVKSAEFGTLLGTTLSSLKVTVEAYPQLKADQQFLKLFDTLEGSENRIRVAIKDYNDYVIDYNLKLRSFPSGIIFSKLFGYAPKDRITPPADKDIKSVPNVDAMLDGSK
ncbi:MAG TPA: LemA family protein [Candidatus Absconditabacterales bacterium]|nr:LemA family protein [Candidatus Absconditabacterales bacterium]